MYSPGQTIDVGDASQIIDVVHVVEGIECIHSGIVHIHAGVDIHPADVIQAAHSIDIGHGIHRIHIHVHVINRSHIIDAAECIYTGHSLCAVSQAVEKFLFAEIGNGGLWQCLCGLKILKNQNRVHAIASEFELRNQFETLTCAAALSGSTKMCVHDRSLGVDNVDCIAI